MMQKNRRVVGIIMVVFLLLMIPLIAMQFTEDVRWTVFDFVVAGTLLLGTGLLCELVIRKVTKMEYRIAICLAILAALFVIWLELAVGIFGTPLGGN